MSAGECGVGGIKDGNAVVVGAQLKTTFPACTIPWVQSPVLYKLDGGTHLLLTFGGSKQKLKVIVGYTERWRLAWDTGNLN